MTRKPESPPFQDRTELETGRAVPLLLDEDVAALIRRANRDYLYWDKAKYLDLPAGLSARDFWLVLKVARLVNRHSTPLHDKTGHLFWYSLTDAVQRSLMIIDHQAGGSIASTTPDIPQHFRQRYLISNLMEEAIASSQLEGAATTRARAKDMLRSGRRPANKAERMIANNYQAILRIKEIVDEPISPERLLELQALLTDGTCKDPADCGRFRMESDDIVVGGEQGEALHVPPPARSIAPELRRLCSFANSDEGDFVHPVLKAIQLHFWLAHLHPFCDGNGRTARALFYFYMRKRGYWLFEYISISRVIYRRRSQYERSFLYSEIDGCDLTYFLTFHLHAIEKALEELRLYLSEQGDEEAALRTRLSQDRSLNHRQRALLARALSDPNAVFTVQSHRTSHGVAYATARADLLQLADKGYLRFGRDGRAFIFHPAGDLREKLRG